MPCVEVLRSSIRFLFYKRSNAASVLTLEMRTDSIGYGFSSGETTITWGLLMTVRAQGRQGSNFYSEPFSVERPLLEEGRLNKEFLLALFQFIPGSCFYSFYFYFFRTVLLSLATSSLSSIFFLSRWRWIHGQLGNECSVVIVFAETNRSQALEWSSQGMYKLFDTSLPTPNTKWVSKSLLWYVE